MTPLQLQHRPEQDPALSAPDDKRPPPRGATVPRASHPRVPFNTIDEVSRHCLTPHEPETIHIEVHLPGTPDPARLRRAFGNALQKHPRILVREEPGSWFRSRYTWQLTDTPDAEPVHFPQPGPHALAQARTRALEQSPPLSASPPVRLELIRHTEDDPGCVLVLTAHHTALDAPAFLRVLATAAELYGGADNPPAPKSARPAPHSGSAPRASRWRRPARIAADRPAGAPAAAGNGLLLADLPVPERAPKSSDSTVRYTVNDQLLVATSLTVARWNRAHGTPSHPVRITMPIDDRDRGPQMPIGNGTRLVDVDVSPADEADGPLLSGERPDPGAIARLLRQTAQRTRALKSASPKHPLGRGASLLTAPVMPIGARGHVTRAMRKAAAPWTSTVLLTNIGRVPYPLDFGDAGRAHAVWFSAPAHPPRGLSLATAATHDRLHISLRWSRQLLGDQEAATFWRIWCTSLAATTRTTP